MKLTALEMERLSLFSAAEFARRVMRDGVRLSYPEAVALIADEVQHAARRGLSYDKVRELGMTILTTRDVLPGVAELADRIQVEPMFDDGVLLVTLDRPIQPAPPTDDPLADEDGHEHHHHGHHHEPDVGPGAVWPASETRTSNPGADPVVIEVVNMLDRPVQVTSHYHFFEVNRALVFDRQAAYGRRLDVPAGLSVRFEPGETQDVTLIPIGGGRVVRGHCGLVDGPLDDPQVRQEAMRRMELGRFGDTRG